MKGVIIFAAGGLVLIGLVVIGFITISGSAKLASLPWRKKKEKEEK